MGRKKIIFIENGFRVCMVIIITTYEPIMYLYT